MPTQLHPSLAQQLWSAVLQRTNRQVWNLAVEVQPGQVILKGEANSFYAKQMAQETVRKLLPKLPLVNAICVAV